MKFAFCLFKYFPYGGLSRDFRVIVQTLLEKGHTIDIYALTWEGEVIPGTQLIRMKKKHWMNHRCYQAFSNMVLQALPKKQYDAIVGFNKIAGLDVYYAADPCYLKRAKAKQNRLDILNPRHRCLHALESCIFHPMSRVQVLALSDNQIQDFHSSYHTPTTRFHLLPPWLDQHKFPIKNRNDMRINMRKTYGFTDKDKLILFVGSGFKTKGLDRAIIAIASLPESLRETVKFFVIGQDKKDFFEKLAKRYGIEHLVCFLGGRSDVPDFIAAADLLLHPAYAENTGNVLLEAVISGLPVLTTAICGFSSHITRANAGLVLKEPFSQQGLNQALQYMLTDEVMQKTWHEGGLQYAKVCDLSQMPQFAAEVIEKAASEKKAALSTQVGNLKYFFYPELAPKFSSSGTFQEIMQLKGDVYRALEGRKTLSFHHEDRRYFAKLHFGVGYFEIIKNLFYFRLPIISAKNEFRAIKKIEEIGLSTMSIVGFGKKGINPASQQSFILTKALENHVSLEDFTRAWRTNPPPSHFKWRLIEAVASITNKMHHHGINHRDFYICHLLLDIEKFEAKNEINLDIIDLHRAQLRKKVPLRWKVKDVASLYYSSQHCGLTKRDLYRFIKVYTDSDLKEALKAADFWFRVEKKVKKLMKRRSFSESAPGVISR